MAHRGYIEEIDDDVVLTRRQMAVYSPLKVAGNIQKQLVAHMKRGKLTKEDIQAIVILRDCLHVLGNKKFMEKYLKELDKLVTKKKVSDPVGILELSVVLASASAQIIERKQEIKRFERRLLANRGIDPDIAKNEMKLVQYEAKQRWTDIGLSLTGTGIGIVGLDRLTDPVAFVTGGIRNVGSYLSSSSSNSCLINREGVLASWWNSGCYLASSVIGKSGRVLVATSETATKSREGALIMLGVTLFIGFLILFRILRLRRIGLIGFRFNSKRRSRRKNKSVKRKSKRKSRRKSSRVVRHRSGRKRSGRVVRRRSGRKKSKRKSRKKGSYRSR